MGRGGDADESSPLTPSACPVRLPHPHPYSRACFSPATRLGWQRGRSITCRPPSAAAWPTLRPSKAVSPALRLQMEAGSSSPSHTSRGRRATHLRVSQRALNAPSTNGTCSQAALPPIATDHHGWSPLRAGGSFSDCARLDGTLAEPMDVGTAYWRRATMLQPKETNPINSGVRRPRAPRPSLRTAPSIASPGPQTPALGRERGLEPGHGHLSLGLARGSMWDWTQPGPGPGRRPCSMRGPNLAREPLLPACHPAPMPAASCVCPRLLPSTYASHTNCTTSFTCCRPDFARTWNEGQETLADTKTQRE